MNSPVPGFFLRLLRWPIIHGSTRLALRFALARNRNKLPSEVADAVESFFVHDLCGNVDTTGEGKPDSFQLAVTNAWIDQHVTGIELTINGKEIDPEKIIVDNDFARVRGNKIRKLRFLAGHPFTITVEGRTLRGGLHFIGLELQGELANFSYPLIPFVMKKGEGTMPLLTEPWDRSLEPYFEEIHPATIHFCPHIHYDFEWIKTEDEFLRVAVGNLKEAIHHLDIHPAATFVIDQEPQLDALAEKSPDCFEKLCRFVREGRIEPVLGGYVEPDTNLPCGESLIRQFSRWQSYSKTHFGKYSRTGWLIDSFGMNGQLPQILRKCGAHAIVFSRGLPDSAEVSSDFWWEGIDGTPVQTHHLAHFYNAGHPIDSDPQRATYRLFRIYKKLSKASDQDNLFCPSGIDHGRPQPHPPEAIKRWNDRYEPVMYEYSLPSKFLKSVDKGKFATYRGELNGEMTGVNAARTRIKQMARKAEQVLFEAETLVTINLIHGTEPRLKLLDRAWQSVLKSGFHDSITGPHTDAVAEQIEYRLAKATEMAGRVAKRQLRNLANRLASACVGNSAFFIFNPTCYMREEIVEVDLYAKKGKLPFINDGRRFIPYQVLSMERYHDDTDKRARVCFKVSVPPYGYRLYYASGETQLSPPNPFGAVKVTPDTMENSDIQVRFDVDKGSIRFVVEKQNGRLWMLKGAGGLGIRKDYGTLYQEFFFGSLKKQKNRRFRIVENGPIRGIMEAEGTIERTRYRTRFTLCAQSRQISIESFVDFGSRQKTLFAEISNDLNPFELTAEIPFGMVPREKGSGIAQNFINLGFKKEKNLTVFNRGIPGYHHLGKKVRMTLHRSVDKIHFMDAGQGALGFGKQNYDYALRFSEGDITDAQPWKHALCFNHPLLIHEIRPDSDAPVGKPERIRKSFAWFDNEAIVISAMTPLSNGGLRIRCYEASGQLVESNLRLGFKIAKARLTDMLDRKAVDLEIERNDIPLEFRPFEIKTIVVDIPETDLKMAKPKKVHD